VGTDRERRRCKTTIEPRSAQVSLGDCAGYGTTVCLLADDCTTDHLTCNRSVTREIKNDTTHLKNDTEAIRNDTAEILLEIARLRAQLPDDQATLQPKTEASESTLARYLDDLTSYAETVCWSGEDSDTDVESNGPPVAKSSKATSTTISAKTHRTMPPIFEVNLVHTEKDIADVMPPPGYDSGPQSSIALPRPKSAPSIEYVDSRALLSQPHNLFLQRSLSPPMNLPRVKTKASPAHERRIATLKSVPNPRISASASTSDLKRLSQQLASIGVSQAESQKSPGAPTNPYTHSGDPIQLEPSPSYYPEPVTGASNLRLIPSVSAQSEPKEEVWVTEGHRSAHHTMLSETGKDILVTKQDTSRSMYPPCNTSTLPKSMIMVSTEIPLSDAIDSLVRQECELRDFADYVQRTLEDDLTTSSKPNEMKVRDFAYKVHTLRTDMNNRHSQLNYDLFVSVGNLSNQYMH
jgi:hypothetical protein